MSLDRKVEKVNIWSRAQSRVQHENYTAGWPGPERWSLLLNL